MTTSEWQSCSDPMPMLRFLHNKASERLFLLFACACCRRVWDYLSDDRSRRTVEEVERFADGLISLDELQPTLRQQELAYEEFLSCGLIEGGVPPWVNAAIAAVNCLATVGLDKNYFMTNPCRIAESVSAWVATAKWTAELKMPPMALSSDEVDPRGLIHRSAERAVQAGLLRDIVGNCVARNDLKWCELTETGTEAGTSSVLE